MTDIYSSLLSNMRGPEGSQINERLERLQQLEKLRKEREAKSADRGIATLGSSRRRNRLGQQGSSSSVLQNSTRRTRSEFGSTEDLSVPDFGGARPKMSSFSETGSLYGDDRSALKPRSRLGSTGSEDFTFDTTGSNYSSNFTMNSDSGSFVSPFTRSYSKPETTSDGENIFAGIADSILRESRRNRTGKDGGNNDYSNNYGSRTLGGSSYSRRRRNNTADDDTSETNYGQNNYNFGETNYGQNLYNTGDTQYGQNSYNSGETEYGQNMYNVGETDYGQNTYEVQYDQDGNYEQNQGNDETEFEHVEVYEIPDDHGEEPLDFIQRLRQGGDYMGQFEVGSKRMAPNSYTVSPIPSVPPMKRAKNGDGDVEIIEEEEESEEDIVALAKNIHATFGIKSPKSPKSPKTSDGQTPDSMTKNFNFNDSNGSIADSNQNGDVVFSAYTSTSPRRSPTKRKSLHKQKDRKSTSNRNSQGFTVNGQEEFEVHELHDDEEGSPLKPDPRSSFYQKTTTDQIQYTQSPGRLDKMHKYFTGKDAKEDPKITRELDGSGVKAEMENPPDETQNILANVKSAINNLVDFSNDGKGKQKTPSSNKKKSTVVNKQVRKVKNGNKSSDSDNDSFQTASESESRSSSRNQSPNQRNDKRRSSKGNTTDKRKSPLTIDDKLKKLEIMTQEKTRKQSIGENDEKKPLPSYMSPTSASQKKTTKSKDSPPTDLVKDVRELKKFVQDNVSEPNTPVKSASPIKDVKATDKVRKVLHDMGTQTSELNYAVTEAYICKHCGKSSDDPIDEQVADDKHDMPEEHLTNNSKIVRSQSVNDNGIDMDQLDGKKTLSKPLSSSNLKQSNNKIKWESKSEKGFPLSTQLVEKRTTPELKRSTSKESINSTSSMFDERSERKYIKSRTGPSNASYMKGTTSSRLKNTGGSSNEKGRKSSAPDIHKAKKDDPPKYSGKGLVAQRAKGFETFSRANSQKTRADIGLQRGNSADRPKADSNSDDPVSPRLAKSKSVDEMHLIKDKTFKAVESVNVDIDSNDNNSDTPVSPQSDKTDNGKLNGDSVSKPDIVKTETSTVSKTDDIKKETNKDSFKKPAVPKKPITKKAVNGNDGTAQKKVPPPISPKPIRKKIEAVNVDISEGKAAVTEEKKKEDSSKVETPLSPRSNVKSDIDAIKAMSKNPKGFVKQSDIKVSKDNEKTEDPVVSDGQFLTLGENPFIKNDLRRRNSFKDKEEESVWEKESRSRDSSLKRSNSFEREKPQKDSSLRRSNTSVGERTSLTQLSWSDSGSSSSLASPFSNKGVSNSKKSGSQSSFHGSYTDLNKDSSETQKVRSGSISSQTSQNSVLNLLNSPSSKRDVVTGAVETDVDAAYTEYVKHQGEEQKDSVHDEASVERSHLEFAKKACDLLEFEMKSRDSSSDSQGTNKIKGDNTSDSQGNDKIKGGNTNTKVMNGARNSPKTVAKPEVNNNKNDTKVDDNIEKQGKKGKKSFLKGKLFKK